jgi:hypothetical protein
MDSSPEIQQDGFRRALWKPQRAAGTTLINSLPVSTCFSITPVGIAVQFVDEIGTWGECEVQRLTKYVS